ncbi:hypothetical protein PFLUV_G00193050 [Perca fluviatilis]|uniref:Uncharacterized protein n=1 Tax=Perca fluviatilis TaxID=8168 RepID=A0A6A5ECU2_PERFL|nr:hypothetical protein PFLUV_G00193050 [Perca fluviatilis]
MFNLKPGRVHLQRLSHKPPTKSPNPQLQTPPHLGPPLHLLLLLHPAVTCPLQLHIPLHLASPPVFYKR